MPRFYVEKDGEWNIFSTIINDFIFDEFVCLDALKARLLYERYKELTEDIDSLLTDRPRVNVMSYSDAIERICEDEPQTDKHKCRRCLYYDVPSDYYPCSKCVDYSNYTGEVEDYSTYCSVHHIVAHLAEDKRQVLLRVYSLVAEHLRGSLLIYAEALLRCRVSLQKERGVELRVAFNMEVEGIARV